MGGDTSLLAALFDGAFTFWGLMAASAKLAVYGFSFLAAGTMLFLVVLPVRDDAIRRSLLRWTVAASVLAGLASIWRVMVQSGNVMGDTAFLLDFEIIGFVIEGPLGTSTLARLIGLALVLLAVAVPAIRQIASVAGVILIAASFALTGHATRDPQWLLAALITVHLAAVCFWFGALLPLYKLAADGKDLNQAAHASHRFGQMASIIVPVLVLVGGAFVYLLLGSVEAVLGTAYGQMLLVKLALVAAVLGIAALNKLRLVPALAAEAAGAADRFRRSLRWEGLVFLSIFTATAFLTTSFTVP